jgi:hypothetical protein
VLLLLEVDRGWYKQIFVLHLRRLLMKYENLLTYLMNALTDVYFFCRCRRRPPSHFYTQHWTDWFHLDVHRTLENECLACVHVNEIISHSTIQSIVSMRCDQVKEEEKKKRSLLIWQCFFIDDNYCSINKLIGLNSFSFMNISRVRAIDLELIINLSAYLIRTDTA